ncbi:hypothetical protein ABPG74_007746 [Tetrahymena malaccensis]
MSFDNYSLASMQFDYQQYSTQSYFESSFQQEDEERKEVQQIFKENSPTHTSSQTQQQYESDVLCLKKNCSSPVFNNNRYAKKTLNEQFVNQLIKENKQSLMQMSDIKNLIKFMKKFHQLKQILAFIENKCIQIESYRTDLKCKLQQSISYFDKYSSVWMKNLIENQINKQILNNSLDQLNQIQTNKDTIIQEINQIKQEVKSCLVILRETPIFALSYNKILMKLEEYEPSSNEIKEKFQFSSTERINSYPVFNEQYEQQSDFKTLETQKCLNFNVNQGVFINKQSKQQNFRLRVALAGINQKNLFQLICIQNQQLKDQKFFCHENTCIVAFSTAFVLISQKIPGIDLMSLGCAGLIQSIINFSNPHRTFSGCLRQQNILISQMTICGGLGLTGTAVGQALIPIPVLGALVGGLVMEFLGMYISSKIKDWSISSQLQKQIKFFAQNNAEVSESNFDQYCDVMDIKKESLKDKIVLPNQHLLDKLLGNEKQIETVKNFGDIEKLQIYLLYSLQNIGQKIYTNIKENLEEDAFNELQGLQNCLESFTEYFDFDYLSIGKNLIDICDLLKEKIQIEDIKNIVEQIDALYIDGNNIVYQQQESIKKYCKFEKLAQLLKEKNIDEKIIVDYLPDSIKTLFSNQKVDLWCTYICIQLLNPSFVFLEIFMMKVNYQLESKNLFFIDTIDQYFPIIKEMFEEI